jgi:diguanylate cyclase (GGDEF)-like protein/PAS domain S-box-containing protein
MTQKDKTKEEFIEEIKLLQKRIAKLETTDTESKQQQIRRLAIVVRDSNDAITIQDFEGKIISWNSGAELMYGYSEQEALKMSVNILTHPEKVAEQAEFIRRLIAGEKITSFETKRVAKDGRILDVWLTVTKIIDDTGKPIGIATTERDITERNNLLNSLKELSLKDTNTELYNYRYLMERLASEVVRARRYVLPLSAIMLDIDYFKSINDVYGHQYGNIILKEFAQFLKGFARIVDIVARYGGEEFVIVLPDTNKEGAIIFGKRLLDAIGKYTFDPEGKKVKLKASIGIASFPEDGIDIGTASGLINSADKALLNAKENGGNKLYTFKDIGKDIEDIVGKGGKENVDELREKLSKMSDRAEKTLLESMHAFTKAIQVKDYYTAEHSENTVSIVTRIGEKLNLSAAVIKTLGQAAILHDLGKVGVPDDILHKKEKLAKKDYEIIKRHPQVGAEIIRPIHFLDKLVPIILYHHERFDGLGYSAGLKGKEIPLGARIIAIADVYQALVSDRPYRKAYSEKEALDIIREGSGTQFDPEIVGAFLAIM